MHTAQCFRTLNIACMHFAHCILHNRFCTLYFTQMAVCILHFVCCTLNPTSFSTLSFLVTSGLITPILIETNHWRHIIQWSNNIWKSIVQVLKWWWEFINWVLPQDGGTLINRHLMEVPIGVAVQTLHRTAFLQVYICTHLYIYTLTHLYTHKHIYVSVFWVGVPTTPWNKTTIGRTPLKNALLVRTLLFTQIRNKFLRRGNLRPLFNCLYDLSDQTQTVTTYDMENCCQSSSFPT